MILSPRDSDLKLYHFKKCSSTCIQKHLPTYFQTDLINLINDLVLISSIVSDAKVDHRDSKQLNTVRESLQLGPKMSFPTFGTKVPDLV